MSERRASWRLRTLATVSIVVAVVVTLLAVVSLSIGFRSQDSARTRILDTLDPAGLRLERLRSALLDQETGVRGYALSNERQFLTPYEDGRRAQNELVDALRELLADEPPSLLASIEAVQRSAETWRTEIATPLLSVEGGLAALAPIVQGSATEFDRIRTELDEAAAVITATRADARRDLSDTTRNLVITTIASVSLLVGVMVAGSWVIRRQVITPVLVLQDDAGRVASGEFDFQLRVDGPLELEELATSVDRMRSRIVADLAEMNLARAEREAVAEDLERSNRDLEQFAYVASHDLQEPLRKVASFCQLLEQRYADQLDDRARTYIEYAVDGAKRMQALISDLLDFSRVGRTTTDFVPVDLGDVAESVERELHRVAEEAGATLQIGDLPVVSGDEALLAALLRNLFGNAIKYRSELPPEVSLTAERSGDEWTFTCRDNGLGVDAKYREQVFVIFQRLHGRDEYEGTGIGLALCKRIVEFHGGRIWFEEPDGSGAIIMFTLPVIEDPATADVTISSEDDLP
ncbi:MAG TPA: ATP-binding protein [Microthrixaceae bacterium]|nr:ATP-binding protein [Microthrixaceae bacterium]